MQRVIYIWFSVLAGLIPFNAPAQVIWLVDINSGSLMGANNIIVDNSVFNVNFSDTNLSNLKNGGYFDPGELDDAHRLSSALASEVLVDVFNPLTNEVWNFNLDSGFPNGCIGPGHGAPQCHIHTPFDDDGTNISFSILRNAGGIMDIYPAEYDPSDPIELIQYNPYTFADWTLTNLDPEDLRGNQEFVQLVECSVCVLVGDPQLVFRVAAIPVPIPASVWLFGTGILGLIGFSKRRKAA